jgi:hypothetical protein
VQKRKALGNYEIFIEEVGEIGYELNKKNTPYKYRKNGGDYILDSAGRPVLENDLYGTRARFESFVAPRGISNIQLRPEYCCGTDYEVMNTALLDDKCILDISRYLKAYKDVVGDGGNVRVRDLLVPDYCCNFKRVDDAEYVYLDIKEINTPLYNGKKLRGHELPGRAKYMLRKGDILVSRLKGNIAFTVIVRDEDNLVCTNGVCVLRPVDEDAGLVLFANLFSNEFKIQHQSLTTGSIMETLADEDIKNIVIETSVDKDKYKKVLDSIAIIQTELR